MQIKIEFDGVGADVLPKKFSGLGILLEVGDTWDLPEFNFISICSGKKNLITT